MLAVVFRSIAHWRGLVVAKHARASEFAAHSLLHFTFGMFVSIWSRRRSRAKELMLACTLLDQVLTWFFISGRFFTFLQARCGTITVDPTHLQALQVNNNFVFQRFNFYVFDILSDVSLLFSS